jgi:hypothetical protein
MRFVVGGATRQIGSNSTLATSVEDRTIRCSLSAARVRPKKLCADVPLPEKSMSRARSATFRLSPSV